MVQKCAAQEISLVAMEMKGVDAIDVGTGREQEFEGNCER